MKFQIARRRGKPASGKKPSTRIRPQLEILEDRLAPARHIFVDADHNGLWSDPRTWDIGAPVGGEQNIDLVFPPTSVGAYVIDDMPGLTINSITFYGSHYGISGANSASGPVPLRILTNILDNAGSNGVGRNLLVYLGVPTGTPLAPFRFIENSPSTLLLDGTMVTSSSQDVAVDGLVQLISANQISGNIEVGQGATLQINNDQALGNATVQLDGGVLSFEGNQEQAIKNAIFLTGGSIQGSTETFLDGPITGPGALTLTMSNYVEFDGVNSYSGGTFFSGTVAVGNDNALGTGPVTTTGPGTLATADLGARTVTLANSITLTSDLTVVGNFTLDGIISGSGGLQNSTGYTLTLNGANTYTGRFVANSGILALGNNSALSSGLLVMKDGTTLDALAVDGNGNKITTLNNAIELDGSVVTEGDELVLRGNISGSGSLTLTNTSVFLYGTNSYQGKTVVNSGVLNLESATALPGTTALVVNLNAQVGLLFDITVGSLAGFGTIQASGLRSITTGGDNSNTTFTGTLDTPSHSPVACTLTKVGTGLFAFSGTSFFGGATTVQGGVLQLDGTLSGDAIFKAGAALTGTGKVKGNVQASGAIDPGDSRGPGMLSTTGATTFQTGSSLNIPLNGTTPGNGYGQFISGSVDLSANPALTFSLNFTPMIGTTFTIVSATSITGTFSGLPDNELVDIAGHAFQIHYSATTVIITAIATPTPTVASLSSVTEGAPAGTMTVTGTGFIPNLTTVQFDGVSVAPLLQGNAQLQFPLPAFPEEGAHTITIANSGAGSISPPFNVADAPLTGTGVSFTGTEKISGTGTIATFGDTGGLEPQGNYTALIDWGDGHATLGSVKPNLGNFMVVGSHAYLKGGIYPIATTILDEGGTALTVNTTGTIAGTTGVLSKFVVSPLGGNTLTAGSPVFFTVQAADQLGNPVNGYSGPGTVPITVSPADPFGLVPPRVTLSNSGFGYFVATFKTKGAYTITATDAADSVSGSTNLTVTPANAVYFTVAAPATAFTNSTFPITVTALDAFHNAATNYTGTVNLSSTDSTAAAAGDLGGNYTFTTGAGQDNGVHVFNVQLLTGGNQKITVADTTATIPAIIGTSSAIATSGLSVTALTKTPTGFTATCNQEINPADLTIYGKGNTQQDVFLVGQNTNNGQPYPGTLIVDASKKLLTFKVSSNYLAASNPGGSAALPDDTYTVTLLSGLGNNGFQDVSGQGFDDGHGGHADFVGTFTTSYQHDKTEVLGIPDFACGPNASGDTSTLVKVPNDPANGGHIGIPITIYNASNLTSAGFTLTYNANILTVTGGVTDPSEAAASFKMTGNVRGPDGIHSVATFSFTRATRASGTQILGDITAYVPYAARNQYQVKDLLTLGNITVNSGATVVPGNAVDVDAYFGDVNGDHHLDGIDRGLIANVAATLNTGFTAFTLLDPDIIGDLSGDNAVTGNSTSLLSNYVLGKSVPTVPALPNPPIADNLFTSPYGADPILSLPATIRTAARGLARLPILLDHPHPAGSSGLVEARLTLHYDPTVLFVTPADITLGSIPSQGTGWHLSAMVNAAIGQITIQLYSETPITSDQAGSLVNVAFHLISPVSAAETTTVRLIDSQTVLADAQAAMILSPGLNWTAVLSSDWVQSLI